MMDFFLCGIVIKHVITTRTIPSIVPECDYSVCAVVIKLRPLYFIVYIMWKFRKLSTYSVHPRTNYAESPQLGAIILADPRRQIVSCTVHA